VTTQRIQPIRGMNDVLPEQMSAWHFVEATARDVFASYGYDELRVPMVEQTDLFKRAIGEYTDVVEKEMFSFVDQGGDSLTLRPEATAGVARAMISNGQLRGARHKLWCVGPMFRHERPQKGRYRQFHQFSVEAIGFNGPDIDIELIAVGARLWKRLGIERVALEINSLGTPESRRDYRAHLVSYFRSHESRLDADSRRRLEGNPLRIFDSKNPEMQDIVAGAPMLCDHLDPESRAHFDALQAALSALGIPFKVNPRLVRGLDYYSRTVFEWITDALGSQNAICSGGRYDGLIAQLGGEPTPAVGFALGIERVVALVEQVGTAPKAPGADVYLIAQGAGNFKAQFRRADRSGAEFALVIGDDELARGVAQLKPLRAPGGEGGTGQLEVPLGELVAAVAARISRRD
jgi:histidyl-tRNA synthetase